MATSLPAAPIAIADISSSQRRRIVHSVTNDSHGIALSLSPRGQNPLCFAAGHSPFGFFAANF
jgi:hypothetical protein